jgi:hypothetical protein
LKVRLLSLVSMSVPVTAMALEVPPSATVTFKLDAVGKSLTARTVIVAVAAAVVNYPSPTV